MHESFIFPIPCRCTLDIYEEVFFEKKENTLYLVNKQLRGHESDNYSPLDRDDLIPEAIKLYEKYEKDKQQLNLIKDWSLKWGFLGDVQRKWEGDYFYLSVEVYSFLKHLEIFYQMWELYKAIVNKDDSYLSKVIQVDHNAREIYVYGQKFSRYSQFIDDSMFLHARIAHLFLLDVIEEMIDNIRLGCKSSSLIFGKDSEKVGEIAISPTLKLGNLSSALFFQLFVLMNKIENENKIFSIYNKICPICNKIFLPPRTDKKYCSNSCKLTAKSRRYRERKKQIDDNL